MSLCRVCLAVVGLSSSALSADYWTTSRIQGTPEPAKPFVAEQVFAGIVLNSALDMVPGAGAEPVVVCREWWQALVRAE